MHYLVIPGKAVQSQKAGSLASASLACWVIPCSAQQVLQRPRSLASREGDAGGRARLAPRRLAFEGNWGGLQAPSGFWEPHSRIKQSPQDI